MNSAAVASDKRAVPLGENRWEGAGQEWRQPEPQENRENEIFS